MKIPSNIKPEQLIMSAIVEMIYQEAQRLPEHLAREVYDFLRFVETRHGIEPSLAATEQAPDWKAFFERHTRTVQDAAPMRRDEIYADRLR
jgi:hypothetical protein